MFILKSTDGSVLFQRVINNIFLNKEIDKVILNIHLYIRIYNLLKIVHNWTNFLVSKYPLFIRFHLGLSKTVS